MCELFAMTAARPATVRYELDAFAAEGGERHANRDGWGIMFAEDRDAHVFREASPAADSPLARMVIEREIACRHLMAHVRRASHGRPLLANTHPYTRVHCGRAHHFAHNGTLGGIEDVPEAQAVKAERVGDTDSELAFLILLARLSRANATSDEARIDAFAAFAADMRALGDANFLFFDGHTLFVHADRRRFEMPDGLTEPREPGLVMRRFDREDAPREWHASGPRVRDLPPQTIVFASVPLDDGNWEGLPRGTVLALRDGAIVGRREG
ncbi:class II glutamine amidotransferase [Novosphingobium sp. ZN18A2]|uniref:class II glutamine amidotransferase n=1 Tax=Novosphingobium sp. ZN18A2 TaxID=3079861 RepID=UPI0030CBE7B1